MDSKKEKLLKKTFDDFIELMLYDFPVERIGDLIAEDVTGYGTTVDEKFLEIKRFKKVVTDQREQGVGIEMHFRVTPIHRRVSPDEDAAVFMDEFEITLVVDGAKNVLPLRLTTVFEFLKNSWKLVHIHGSKAVETEGDTWHKDEWKKKNEELQRMVDAKTADLELKNHELALEAALERVRTAAMAMQKSKELKEVIQVVYEQFVKLNLHIEHTGFIMDYKARNDMHIWLADRHEVPTEITIPYFDSPHWNSFNEAKEKGLQFFTNHLAFEEKNRFYQELFKLIPGVLEETAEYYLSCPGLAISTVLLDNVGLYIENFSGIPYSDEENATLLRFGKVFQQTYTRFLDLQKAEAQAKEAQIENALEKVRSRSLAMHKSDELNEVISVVFEKLKELQIPFTAVGIAISIEGSKDLNAFVCGVNEAGLVITNYRLPYFDNLIANDFYNALEKQVDFFVGHYSKDEKDAFYTYVIEHTPEFRHLPEDIKRMIFESPTYTVSMIAVNKATFNINDFEGKVLADNEVDIIKRFARVFDQAYTRFLDLQKAEAQAREAQIEAALERIRSRALAMQNSSEVGDVSDLLFSELEKMDVTPTGFSIMVFDREQDKYELWRAKEVAHQGVYETFSIKAMYNKLDQYIPGFTEELESKWNSGSPFFIAELRGKKRISFLEANRDMGNYTKEQFENVLRIYPDPVFWQLIFFKHGWLGLIQNEQLPAEDILVIRRFADVFEFAHTRFLDLQKAEAQAREAQIELSLERIRAQVTAMRESSELLDIVVTMRSEFVALGHEAHYFWHMRWLPERYEKAMTSGDGTRIGMVMTLPRHIHGDVKLVADWEKSDEPTLVFAMDVETAVDYVEKMITLGDFQQVDPQAPTLDDIRHIGGLTFIMARTTHGEIGFSLPGTVPHPPQESVATLARFAGVFDLAYKRFEDLKSTERRHREAQIELALERTRTQSMLMRHSSELNDISKTFHEQLLNLGIDSEFSFVWLPDETKQEHMFWATWVNDINGIAQYQSKSINYPLDKTEPGTAACYVAWESGQPVHETYVPPAEINGFFAAWEELLRGAEQFKPQLFPEGIYYTEAYMKYGCFGIDIRRHLSNDEKEIIRRFAVEFERTYTRFLDLKQAEELARQAELDLIRLKEEKRKTEEALTELKTTQAQLIQSEKMASLGELTAGIAHEIQNPLNFVNNFSEVSAELVDEMKQELAVGSWQLAVGDQHSAIEILDDIKQNLEKINHHGKRADAIVKGMLQHSRSSTGQKEPTDINALADEYLRLSYHGLRAKDKSFNADFKTDFDENLPKINIIPQDIGRVLLNLINNAFYAVSEKHLSGFGNLTGLAKTKTYKPTVIITTKNLGDRIEISVRDNGPGIPEEIKNKIFQPFFTTKPTGQGTGLGLSLSYDIAKAHGGDLKVTNHVYEGSEFIISLPIG